MRWILVAVCRELSYPCVRFEQNIEPPEEVADPMNLHPKQSGGREELPDDVSSSAATCADRRYQMRPAEARRRLRAGPGQCPEGGGR
jgi:hypothetical protein